VILKLTEHAIRLKANAPSAAPCLDKPKQLSVLQSLQISKAISQADRRPDQLALCKGITPQQATILFKRQKGNTSELHAEQLICYEANLPKWHDAENSVFYIKTKKTLIKAKQLQYYRPANSP